MRSLLLSNNRLFVLVKSKVICFERTDGHTSSASTSSGSRWVLNSTTYSCPAAGDALLTTVTANDRYLVGGYANKWVCCWDLQTGAVLGSLLCKKRPTSLVLGHFQAPTTEAAMREVVLIADKFGDVWGVDAPQMARPPVLCAGHTTSVITDMVLRGTATVDTRVITADRDEKIRVSAFPNMLEIRAYCLGHTSVVTSLAPITLDGGRDRLLSVGWDHRLFLWDYELGRVLACFQPSNAAALGGATTAAPEAEAEADTEADAEGEGEGEAAPAAPAGGEEDGDGLEKTYDESSAGSYPLKVVALGSSRAAVIYKNRPTIDLFLIEETEGAEASVALRLASTLTLPALPADLLPVGDSGLLVLLPEPHFLQAYALQPSTQTLELDSSVDLEAFSAYCAVEKPAFRQQVVSTEEGDDERGMKKHNLDRPYDKERNKRRR